MHQLPSTKYPMTNILKTIFTDKVPVLFIMGEQLSIKDFNFPSMENLYKLI